LPRSDHQRGQAELHHHASRSCPVPYGQFEVAVEERQVASCGTPPDRAPPPAEVLPPRPTAERRQGDVFAKQFVRSKSATAPFDPGGQSTRPELGSSAAGHGGRSTPSDPDPAFGIYIHWPFCRSKCPYCDFNSHVRHGLTDQRRFVRAFTAEIAATAARTPGRTVSSVFFGGGTPSLMEPQTVAAILDAIATHWHVSHVVEVTLEANPTSVEARRFAGYRAAGVNRVSLGVQALDDAALSALGRTHTAREALDAVAIARRIFERYSFDLIYARPGQTLAEWRAELVSAISQAAEHLSLYQLTIEPGTPFAALNAAGKLTIPDADHARNLYDVTQEACAAAGLPAYEVSNHARPGAECRHNLVYWRCHEYAGIGPGAHGRLEMRGGVRHATATERQPEAWLALVEQRGHGLVTDEPLSRVEAASEYLLMGLRLAEGIDLNRFQGLAGRPLAAGQIAHLAQHGLIETPGAGRLRVTAAGFPVLDAVVADLAA
jgi:putative oxygen-independent coproporphyrinogen III oxidase